MQRSVEALLEAFPYSICQGWEAFHSSELERFCIESGDLFYVHFYSSTCSFCTIAGII